MSDMQSMVDKMRSDEHQPSQEEQDMAEQLIDMLLAAVESGKITAEQAKDIIRKAPNTMDEMSATGGGVGSGGATFTPGSGMAYAQALDKPKKKMKEGLTSSTPGIDVTSRYSTSKKSAITGDGQDVEEGDDIYYRGYPMVIQKVYQKGGSIYLKAYSSEEDTTIDDIASRFKSNPPSTKESKDKESKLAAGKLKKNYAVDKFGFKPAPSIPNRPSTGGFQYKDLWAESHTLDENYSRFRKAVRERDNTGQYHTGVGIVRKKLAEVDKMMEYLATLKSDLSTAGMVNETSHTKKSLEKMTEMIKNIYAKHKKLK
jgi:hypothetical protein